MNRSNIQNVFLETLKHERTQISVYLRSGIHLNGWIEDFDSYAIWLGSPRGSQLIYKHSIMTVLPVAQTSAVPDVPDTAKNRDTDTEAGRGDRKSRLMLGRRGVVTP